MTDAAAHDPQSDAAQPIPSPRYTGYRLVVFSVRGHKYLVGNTTVHPVEEILPGVGTRFSSPSAIDRYVRRELAGLSCYYAAQVVDDDGRVLMRGVRSGVNGTGNTWIWSDSRPREAPAPA